MRRTASEVIRNLEMRIARLEKKSYGMHSKQDFLMAIIRTFNRSSFVSKPITLDLKWRQRGDLEKAMKGRGSQVAFGKTSKGGNIYVSASEKKITFDIEGNGFVYDGEGAVFTVSFKYGQFLNEDSLYHAFIRSVENEGFEARTASARDRLLKRFDRKPKALDIDLQSDLEMVAEKYNLVAVCTTENPSSDRSISKELKVSGDRLDAGFPTSKEAKTFLHPLSVEGVALSQINGETHHHRNNFSYGIFHSIGGSPQAIWVGLVPKKYSRPPQQQSLINAGFSNDNPKVESEVRRMIGEFAGTLVLEVNRLRK
jgi:hypothetical protein